MCFETAKKMLVICGFCSLALLLSCSSVSLLLLGEGAISEVSPVEGTIGTEMTISGANLGAIVGEVFVGDAKAEVLQWSDTQIVARVSGSLPAGDYDVTVKPWWETSLTYSYFTIKEPELVASTFHPQFLSGGETKTLTGKFLGNQTGTVSLENKAGQIVQAEVSDWSMECITFQVPTGLSGLWNITVANDVSEVTEYSWCTFQACPTDASREATSPSLLSVAHDTRDTPAPIQYDGALWVISAGGDSDLICDAYTNCESWTNMPDPSGESYCTPCPIVIDGTLWLFNTTRDGTVEYFTYTSAVGKWTSPVQVPNVSTPNNSPVGVAYNGADPYDRIELFYYSGGKIYRTYSDNRASTWSTPTSVISGADWGPSALFWESAVYWDSTNSVTVSVPNATLVTYQLSNGIAVAFLQDGQLIYTVKRTVNASLEYFQPNLVDLGEDYLAVVCSDTNCEPAVRKISKSTGKWESTWRPISNSKTTCWSTNGGVGVKKVADATSEGGYRYDTYFYLFWGKNDGGLFDDDEWTMSQVEYLGYYIEPEPPVACDFGSEQADTFYLWPLIGIMDAPPFVANGVDIAAQDCTLHDCTRVEFGAESASFVSLGGSVSGGPYVETGEHCKLKLEISAEVNASINTEKALTSLRTDTLYRDMEGVVLALYLTPQFKTHTYEWFDHGDTATSKYFYVVEVALVDVTKKTFVPTELPVADAVNVSEPYWSSFPTHIAETDIERLSTYGSDQSENYWFRSSGDWSRASDGVIGWSATTTTETEAGLEIKFKVGKNTGEKGKIGGGVEGSFELHASLTTELTADAKTYLINADASDSTRGDVSDFHVIGYWLAPNDSAYWLPRNRQGMGDKPWFITYWVSSVTPY